MRTALAATDESCTGRALQACSYRSLLYEFQHSMLARHPSCAAGCYVRCALTPGNQHIHVDIDVDTFTVTSWQCSNGASKCALGRLHDRVANMT